MIRMEFVDKELVYTLVVRPREDFNNCPSTTAR